MKLPTAGRGLGNGKVEGGLAVPVSFALAGPVTMTLGPELDLLADFGRARPPRRAGQPGQPVGAGRAAADAWPASCGPTSTSIRPARSGRPRSTRALAYAVSDDLQLDIGANLGLTRDTPDLELYAGASIRF